MKKLFASVAFILVFSVYALFQHIGDTVVAVNAPVAKTSPIVVKTAKPKGKYADGTYVGSAADAYYGSVQVQATISNGTLADVRFLQYPNDRSTSRVINETAMSVLKQEAISAQSANVNGVSGASDTSAAFKQSLASALSKARV
jgi:uncharacterized protein with FMN-binding domain